MQPTTTPTITPTTQTNTDPSQFGNYSDWAQQEMAKGFSAQQLQQTLSSSNITPQASQSSAPAQTGSSPNFLERLLPTAGGVVGGILGDLLPGGPITGIAGAGAGDALGKSLEDKLTGQGGGNGVLGAAVSGGVGQGVGSALSGLAGAALGKVTGALGNVVDGRAAQVGVDAAKAAQNKITADAIQKAAADNTDQTNEIQRLADEFKPQENDKVLTPHIGDTVNSLKDLGIEKPTAQDAINVGNVKTGANDNGPGIINQEKQNILATAGGTVKLGQPNEVGTPSGNLLNNLRDPSSIARLGDPLNEGASPASAIVDKFQVLAHGAGLPPEGSQEIDPVKGFKLLSDVSDEARNASRTASKLTATPADVQTSAVWNGLKNDLKNAVYNRPEVNDAVANYKVTPEISDQIDKKIAAEGITDPEVAANLKQNLTNTLNNGQTMQNWLQEEAKAVKMSQIGESATKQQGNITTAASQRLAKGKLEVPASETSPDSIPVPIKTPSALDTFAVGAAPLTHGASLAGLLPHAITAAKNPEVQDAVYKQLSKVTGKVTASKILPLLTRSAAIGATNLPNDAATTSAIPGTANGINSNSTGSSAMQPQQQSPLQQLYSAVLAQEQAPGASLTPGYSAMNSTLSALAPQVQKQQLEAPAISNAVSGFANAGGAQGTDAGILSKLSGLIPGTAANTYNSQQSSAASALAQLLGISPESAMSLLPQLTQSTQTAASQMGGLSSILGSLPTATAQ